jgi:hypothetical protein
MSLRLLLRLRKVRDVLDPAVMELVDGALRTALEL